MALVLCKYLPAHSHPWFFSVRPVNVSICGEVGL